MQQKREWDMGTKGHCVYRNLGRGRKDWCCIGAYSKCESGGDIYALFSKDIDWIYFRRKRVVWLG